MKNLDRVILYLWVIVSFTFGCKKPTNKSSGYSCSTCKTTPDALAANDNSSKGIYKGIVTGSSGTIQFDISNSGNSISATFTLDGVVSTLQSNVTWQAGQSYIAPFKGTMGGNEVSITFSVSAAGQNPTITAYNIPGHTNVNFTLVKETSTMLIESFEGTYSTSKPEEGVFNIILSRSLKRFEGTSKAKGSSSINTISGTINQNNELVDGKVLATLKGDEINGSFKNSDNHQVTVKGKRTL